MADDRRNPLKKASICALVKELRKRKGIDCLVIDDEYVLKIKKKDMEVIKDEIK